MLNSGKKYNLMLHSGPKKNVLTLELSETVFLNETKKHKLPPPFKLNGLSLKAATETTSFASFFDIYIKFITNDQHSIRHSKRGDFNFANIYCPHIDRNILTALTY